MIKCPQCGRENPQDSKFCNDCGFNFTGEGTGKLNPDTILEGRYIIVKTIGRGGMGAVYLALDTRLNNMPVAIKEMSTQAVGGDLQAAIASFQKEAALLISLRHPSLPVIRDFFSHSETRWYLVMDYIEGQSLKQFVDKNGPVPEAQVLDWAKQLCDILSYLHCQSPPIIFRDLKPSNIMLTPQGQIKLIDFGIARHFRQGSSTDTSAYGSSGFAPPEQYGQNQTDPRADIYALGATLHYLLTSIDPSAAPFNFDPPSKHAKISPRMETAIMKALDLKSENRPRDARELLSILPQGKVRHVSVPKSNSSTIKQDIKAAKDITADLPATTPIAGADVITKPEQKSESKTAPLATSQMDMEKRPQTQLKEQVVTDKALRTPSVINKAGQANATAPLSQSIPTLSNEDIPPTTPINMAKDIKSESSAITQPLQDNYKEIKSTSVSGLGDGNTTAKVKSNKLSVTIFLAIMPLLISIPIVWYAWNQTSNTQVFKESEMVVFNDPVLEKAVRETINKPTGDVTAEDVDTITELVLPGENIRDISGLKYFSSLQFLQLCDNQITEIESLRGLTNLQVLDLSGNQIGNIESLRGLTNLGELNLSNNQINDIQFLQGLTNLGSLYLSNNLISDIEPLRGLNNLRELTLDYNQISDIEPLRGLTNIQALILYGNSISDYSPIQGFNNLSRFDASQFVGEWKEVSGTHTDISIQKIEGEFWITIDGSDYQTDYLEEINSINVVASVDYFSIDQETGHLIWKCRDAYQYEFCRK